MPGTLGDGMRYGLSWAVDGILGTSPKHPWKSNCIEMDGEQLLWTD
jgi:hypothetical protein